MKDSFEGQCRFSRCLTCVLFTTFEHVFNMESAIEIKSILLLFIIIIIIIIIIIMCRTVIDHCDLDRRMLESVP